MKSERMPIYLFSIYLFSCLLLLSSSISAQEKIRALIIDGQNNHADWPKTTMMMKQYLEETGRFTVDISRTKYIWNGGKLIDEFPLDDGKTYSALENPRPDPDFQPEFSKYDVVISNFGFNAATWPEPTRKSFTNFVRGGGGLVIVHAANNSFGDWKEFNQMIGLGGWGGRDAKSGPYVYLDEKAKTVRDGSEGSAGGHGPEHEFQVVIRDEEHPITAGLPKSWLHAKDELYHQLRGPAENMKILGTAFSAKEFQGTGRHEPMMMALDYGQGRIYHTPMGHADYSMECAGFITTFQRGTEWAATGKVTLTEIPEDFPSRDKTGVRAFKSDLSK